MNGALERAWRHGGALSVLLAPLAALYGVAVERRAQGYRDGRLAIEPSALPVVVVGNLTVGGTGKTPLTAHLVDAFRARGWRPGIVSRGHAGERQEEALLVADDDVAARVGDEPLMLRRRTGAPVCVCVHRARAVARLATETDCDLVLSDDGLQHGAMARDAEIVVIDAAYGFGNGRLLPAGPLRERAQRLGEATLLALRRDRLVAGPTEASSDGSPDMADVHRVAPARAADSGMGSSDTIRTFVTTALRSGPLAGVPGSAVLESLPLPPAFEFATGAARVRNWPGGRWRPLGDISERHVHAVAGIARPERFFAMLREHGLSVTAHPFPDHHAFRSEDLRFDDGQTVLVTSKDAVKLDRLDRLPDGLHEVAVDVRVAAPFDDLIDALSERLRHR